MADPHNINRYGETWPQKRIDESLKVLELIKPYVVISGGWAWHFMSPKKHIEFKHAHDHKDIDILVPPEYVGTVISILKSNDFEKARTIHDGKSDDFIRYEKREEYKITIDLFTRNAPFTEIDGWKVIEVNHLISLYKDIHSTDNCFAVKAASRLIEKGINPINSEKLMQP